MTTIRRFCCNDILRISSLLIDFQNDTKNLWRYMAHLAVWTNCFHVAAAPGNRIMGYIIGHVRGKDIQKNGHINSVILGAEYRRTDVIKKLMCRFEDVNDKIEKAYSMSAWTRPSSTHVTQAYQRLGYVIYKQVQSQPGKEYRIELRKPLPALLALTEYVASIQKSAANMEGVPYQDMTSWPSAEDDGIYWTSDDDETSVPSSGGEPSVPSHQDVTNVLAEGGDMTKLPSAGDFVN
ncbi:GNAT domain [Macleaya cordata]|uniref:GNAT domain n=1 Tax=Macleaya cordata TaxID=56857 RepID=A0A200QQ59_MACCD|nr:GNAT domain [Macleaya cordata]